MQRLSDALKVLLKYAPDGDVCAEHDEIYLTGPSPSDISGDDAKELERVRCRWDASTDSWVMFT